MAGTRLTTGELATRMAAAALLFAAALLAARWALEQAWRLRGSETILAPSPADVEDVISGAIRIAREAAAGER